MTHESCVSLRFALTLLSPVRSFDLRPVDSRAWCCSTATRARLLQVVLICVDLLQHVRIGSAERLVHHTGLVPHL